MRNSEDPPIDRFATTLVAFMWGAYFLNYCDRQAIFAMFAPLQQELQLTDEQLGLTGSIFLWVYGVGCPLAGALADTVSKRWLVMSSLVVWSLVTLATGFSTSALMLLSFRAAMGVSESLFMPAAIALTANAHSAERRSRAVSYLTTAQIVGSVAGSWFGGWMAQHGYWREAFFILGIVGMLYAIPYNWFLLRVQDGSSVAAGKGQRSAAVIADVCVPTLGLLCVVFPIFVFGLWMLYSWLPTFLREKYGLTQADAAFMATVYLQSATLVGLLAGGSLGDRAYTAARSARYWLLAISLLVCGPCLHLLGASESKWGTCLSAVVYGLASGIVIGNIFPAAFEVIPLASRAFAVGILNLCGAIVSGFAPWIVGRYKVTWGMERLLSCAALAYLVAALLVVIGVWCVFPLDVKRLQRQQGEHSSLA